MKVKFWTKAVEVACCLAVILMIIPMFTSYAGVADNGGVKYLKYGVVTPLSGSAAPWGITQKRAVELACEDVNNHGGFVANGVTYKWSPSVYDSKYDVKEARTSIERLVASEGAKYINIMGTALVLGSEDILMKNNIMVLGNVYGGKKFTNPEHPLWFRILLTTKERPIVFYPYLKKKEGIKKIALITQDTEGGSVSLEEGRAAAEINGLKVVAAESFEMGTTDFYPILTRILMKKPDMIDTTLSAGDEPALITKQARELGFNGVIYVGTLTEPTGYVKTATPKYAEGAYIAGLAVDLTTDMQKSFRKLYEKKFGKDAWNPDAFEYANAVYFVTDAIKKANTIDTSKVADTLGKMDFDTFSGVGRFGGESIYGIKRQLVIPDYLAVIKDGKAVQEAVVPPPTGY
ncbi:MAG: ABC transporter substrate-binding protein [Deltaproteobacteria bacterium]|nr:ABC transporter substrate-binding protein [Deltaproteobacteria bacterium]